MGGANGSADDYWDAKVSGNASPILPISRSHSPAVPSSSPSPLPAQGVWSSAAAKGNGYGYVPDAKRFLTRHLRKLSTSLPSYKAPHSPPPDGAFYPANHRNGRDASFFARLKGVFVRRLRLSTALTLLVLGTLFFFTFFHHNPLSRKVRGATGGSKFVIILAANQGGGVMTWKGPKEWAVERDSIANKKAYAERWGYHLEIKDMSTKKRYAHEWRESWEKVDVIKQTMRQYPRAEWFWWMDLHTFIMEPSVSLQSHIFRHLDDVTYRDINIYNPLNISHPPTAAYLDEVDRSPIGDGDPNSINIIVPQDCGGFNLGSFMVKRSEFSERLLDIWWDPVGYEQKHMEWEHKEQDALEYLYTNQPWIRTGTAFIPQRMINSFPPGACAETPEDPRIFYNEKERDFVVNMAGCEWGRDCWGEMASYRKLSERLNSGWRNWF